MPVNDEESEECYLVESRERCLKESNKDWKVGGRVPGEVRDWLQSEWGRVA